MYRFLLDIADPGPVFPETSTAGSIIIAVLLIALICVAAYFIVKKIKKGK